MAGGTSTGDRALLGLDETRELVRAALRGLHIDPDDVEPTTEHLVQAEIRDRGGFERLFILADTIDRFGRQETSPMRIVRESPASAMLDGGGHLGYAVATRVTAIAIEKARASGLAVVGANNHRYSGVIGVYVEQVAREGMVAIAVTSGNILLTAPFGGRERRLSTNPIAAAFPTDGDPVVWDVATSAAAGTHLATAAETNTPLPDGVAVDADGRPTTDAVAALAGAVVPWGGHRGSGLAVSVQLLGLLCGFDVASRGPAEWEAAFLLVAIDPELLTGGDDYRHRATEFAEGIRGTATAPGHDAVRMPADRSMGVRRRRLAEGIDASAADAERLRALASRAAG